MVNRLIMCLLLAVVFSCTSNKNRFEIEGSLPGTKYDGEWVFLVPLENAPVERVDSVQIKQGTFQFSGNVESDEIYIIRTRPALRLSVQELLVVKEAGNIKVHLNEVSHATGTAQNDSLQLWKENKMRFDIEYSDIHREYLDAAEAEKQKIKEKADSLHRVITHYHFQFVRNNRNGVVGKAVLKMYGGSFSPEQKAELGLE